MASATYAKAKLSTSLAGKHSVLSLDDLLEVFQPQMDM